MKKNRANRLSSVGMIAAGVLAFSIGGCQSSAPPVRLNRGGTLTIVVYKGGWPAASGVITPQDKLFSVLKRLLHTKSDWHTSLTDYGPHILVRGKGFAINLISGRMVVNYSISATADAQVVHKLSARDYHLVLSAASALPLRKSVDVRPESGRD